MPLIASNITVKSGEKCESVILPGSQPEPLTVSERARETDGHITIFANDQPESPVIYPTEPDMLEDMASLSLDGNANESDKTDFIVKKPKRRSTRKR